MEAYVKLEDVTKVYHMGEVEIRAADGINFEIMKGEFVVIVGPSGAGKTTVLNVLGGMDTATSGSIMVDGKDISSYNARELTAYRRDDIGFVFQFYNLITNLTALENVELALQICRDPLPAKRVLVDVGLEGRMKNFPAQLSGGEQQRVSIARALAMGPKMLFFDEPTSALDPELTGDILRVIQSLAKEKMTMLIVTHEMAFARSVADRVIFMAGGVIVEQGKPEDVIDNPQNERTRSFLAKLTR